MKSMAGYLDRLNEHADVIARDIRTIENTKKQDATLLDIGCGVGSFLLCCHGRLSVGVDISYDAAALCSSRGIAVGIADANRLPLADHSFDIVRAKEVLEHIIDPLGVVREVNRVLRQDGLFICHVPTQFSILYPFGANFYDDYTHLRPFSKRGFVHLMVDGGFRVLKIEGYTSPRDWWQKPITPVLSYVIPWVWRVIATPVVQSNGDTK